MMKKILTSFLLITLTTIFSPTLKAQNLVPNPSFEQYDTCPNYENQLRYAMGWQNWLASPDYYNACAAVSTSQSVPINCGGYDFQYAHTGQAYAGLFTYWPKALSNPYPWIRDLIGVKLMQPLVPEVKYYVSMYVNLATYFVSPCACNRIGFKFTMQSDSSFANTYTSPLVDDTAFITTDTLLTDTANWMLIKGSYVADSAYQYLVIGNFFDNTQTDTVIMGSMAFCYSYYFVDDVCVSADSATCFPITGVEKLNYKDDINIFPNPTHNQIEINCNEILSLMLYDVLGRVIYLSEQEIISPLTINTSSFSRGIYFLRAKTREGVVARKVVLE